MLGMSMVEPAARPSFAGWPKESPTTALEAPQKEPNPQFCGCSTRLSSQSLADAVGCHDCG